MLLDIIMGCITVIVVIGTLTVVGMFWLLFKMCYRDYKRYSQYSQPEQPKQTKKSICTCNAKLCPICSKDKGNKND